MKRFTIGAVLVSCMLAFTMAGCAAAAKSVDSESLKGFWVLDESAKVGFEAVLNLDDEGVAELMVADSYVEGTWTTDGKTASIAFDDESAKTAPIFVSNGKLTLGEEGGSKLVFSKGDMESYFAEQGSSESVELTGENGEELEIVDEVINDITPISIADDEIVKIEATGKGTDFTGDPGYRLSVQNKTDKTIFLTSDDPFKVGDKEVEGGVGDVIEAGKTAEVFLYFPKDEIEGGVDGLKSVTGTLTIGDDSTGDDIKTYDIKIVEDGNAKKDEAKKDDSKKKE